MWRCCFLPAVILVGCNALFPYDGPASGAGEGSAGGGSSEDCEANDADRGPCGALPNFADGRIPSRVIYASPEAGTEADGSRGRPYDLATAMTKLSPGVALRLLGGTYTTPIEATDLRGTAEAPIWIGGCPSNLPLIEGDGLQPIMLTRPQYVLLHDIEISGPVVDQQGAAVIIDDGGQRDEEVAHHVGLYRLDVHDLDLDQELATQPSCIKLFGLYDFFVTDSSLKKCAIKSSDETFSHGIDTFGSHRGVIARNEMNDIPFAGVSLRAGSSDIQVLRNRLLNIGVRAIEMGASAGESDFRPTFRVGDAQARKIVAAANVVVTPLETGISFDGCVDCTAANNTILRPPNDIVRINNPSPEGTPYANASNGRFVNNIVDGGDILIHVLRLSGGPAIETFRFEHNVWSLPILLDLDGAQDINNIGGLADVGVDASDYTIKSGGPAHGVGLAPVVVAGDLFGNCYADTPSAGAHEPQ